MIDEKIQAELALQSTALTVVSAAPNGGRR
jgi:hypothetical protein